MRQDRTMNYAASVAYIVTGLILILFPTLIGDTICYIIGGGSIAVGAISIIGYFSTPAEMRQTQSPMGLANGIVPVLIGLFVIIKSNVVISIIPFIIGIMIILSGVNGVQRSLNLKSMGVVNYKSGVITSVIMIIFGIVVAANPFKSAQLMSAVFGAGLIVSGLGSFILQLRIKKYMKKAEEEDFL